MDTGQNVTMDAGVSIDWGSPPPLVMDLDGVPEDVERLRFLRQDKSCRGLAGLKRLKTMWAGRANQEMIDAISELPDLEVLSIKGMSATSLKPLARNRKLKRLILVGGGKIQDMEWTLGLSPTLEVLALDSFFRATDIGPVGQLTNLRTLGLEGGFDTKLRLESLAQLSSLGNLRYLFLASTRVADKSLSPLRGLTSLRQLDCGMYFPDQEFIELKKSLPGLKCDWIEMIEEHGSLKKAWPPSRQDSSTGDLPLAHPLPAASLLPLPSV